MNDAIRTQISAIVDDELPENEAEMLLRRMSQDRDLRQLAAEYMAMGRVMRGERIVVGMEDLRERIAAAIDDKSLQQDLDHVETGGPRYLRPLAGIAIAATVAMAAILGLQQISVVQDVEQDVADAVADVNSTGYTIPDQVEDQLREYYLRHSASASYIGASSFNARLVTLELRDGVVVEIEPAEEPADEDMPASEESLPQQAP